MRPDYALHPITRITSATVSRGSSVGVVDDIDMGIGALVVTTGTSSECFEYGRACALVCTVVGNATKQTTAAELRGLRVAGRYSFAVLARRWLGGGRRGGRRLGRRGGGAGEGLHAPHGRSWCGCSRRRAEDCDDATTQFPELRGCLRNREEPACFSGWVKCCRTRGYRVPFMSSSCNRLMMVRAGDAVAVAVDLDPGFEQVGEVGLLGVGALVPRARAADGSGNPHHATALATRQTSPRTTPTPKPAASDAPPDSTRAGW